MTTTTTTTATTAFATAVREALSDLPPEERDDLTDGLEADLAERAAESGSDLGDPRAYADELRAAAGYPPRSARSHLGAALPDLRTLPQELRRRWNDLVARHSLIASLVAFFVALRPVWWVFRGLAVYAILMSLLGASAFGATWWPIAVAAVVLSVQLGRGRMQGRAWVRWTQRVVSGVVILVAPFLLGALATNVNLAMSAGNVDQGQTWYPSGLTRDGMPIDNIFAFDAAGQPIEQVQLFDQDGQPLDLTSDTSMEWWNAQDGSMLVPSDDVPGRAGWNVYPLAHVNDWADIEDDGQLDDSEISPTDFPFGSAKPLAGSDPAVTAQPMTPQAAPAD